MYTEVGRQHDRRTLLGVPHRRCVIPVWRMGMEVAVSDKVTIEIDRMYFEKLAQWASVGRTIDAAIEILDQFVEHVGKFRDLTDLETNRIADAADFVIQELRDLKQPLDACNSACKEVRWKLQLEDRKRMG